MRPLFFVAAAVAVLASPVMAAPAAHPDFTGVWSVAGYSPTLKTEAGKAPPLTPAAQAVYDKNRALAAKGDKSFDPTARCIPEGMPRLMLINKPFEIQQRDKAVYFVHQNRLPHRAYFNEALPTDAEPLYLGYSVAKWEGDTLVIETSGFRDVTFLDDSGLPHSDALKLTERYSLARDGKTFSLRMTIDDPKTFTQPWTAVARYQKRPGFQMPEEVCAESLKTTAPPR